MNFLQLSDELQEILRRVFPDVELHREVPLFTKDVIDDIFFRMTQFEPIDAKSISEELSAFISSLNRSGDFTLSTVAIERPTARFVLNDLDLVKYVSNLDQIFRYSLGVTNIEPEHAIGRILYSAMRFGGLLRKEFLEVLYHQLRRLDAPCVLEQEVWFDLVSSTGEYKRWNPDSLTLLMITSWFNGKRIQGKRKSWYRQLCDFFKKYSDKSIQPLSEGQLIRGVSSRLAIEVTPTLVDIANGEVTSFPITRGAFLRLITRKAPRAKMGKGNSRKEYTLSRSSLQLVSESPDDFFVKHIEDLLNASADTERKQLSATLDDQIEQMEWLVSPQLIFSTRWLSNRLLNDGAWSKSLTVQTSKNRYKRINKVLKLIDRDRSFTELSNSEVSDLYTRVLEGVAKRAEKETDEKKAKRLFNKAHNLAAALRDFHDFMTREYGIEANHVPDTFILRKYRIHKVGAVDADVLMPWEYLALKKFLSGESKKKTQKKEDADLLLAQLVLLILGYRTGMRRSEVHYLRLTDFHIPVDLNGEQLLQKAEIVVSPHSQRSLKSVSGYRRIPVGALVTPTERSTIFAFFCTRLNESGENSFLFNITSNNRPFLTAKALFEPLAWYLRAVTGNPRMRFHHLRHSFGTWRFWSWMPTTVHAGSLIARMSTPEIIAQIGQERMAVLDVSEPLQPSRKTLHAISLIIGHAHPSTTLHHYIHTASLIFESELMRLQPTLRNKELSALAGITERGLFEIVKKKGVPNTELTNTGELTPCILRKRSLRLLRRKSSVANEVKDWRPVIAEKIGLYRREPSGERLELIDLYLACREYFDTRPSLRILEDKYSVHGVSIEQTIARAESLFELKKEVRKGNRVILRARHSRKRTKYIEEPESSVKTKQTVYVKELVPLPRQTREMMTLERMLLAVAKLTKKQKQKLHGALEYFITHSQAFEQGIEFTSQRPFSTFISAMRLLDLSLPDRDGKPVERLRATICIDGLNQESKLSSRAYWNKNVGFKKSYQFEYRDRKRKLTHKNGYVLLDLMAPEAQTSLESSDTKVEIKKRRTADNGFRVGLYVLYLTQDKWMSG
ncbi:hypothetical protein FM042_07960 [Aliidiomarina halalkaliphila]|uniref:Tyr recombinase domain-containing protein n=1 Tax=Aliidiomarina halalkaliphila TaxID=2593535 RepID=A0A552X1I4_9GAMM|nr:hypothetical protein [Aliidiomarina halalkaliphila]TRW48908.1 hypothetical protein FM042_07960 [Aliidiomarina halalkaliphila]